MTSYFSAAFLLAFLPATVACYQLAPRRARWAVLLAASYAFFWVLSGPLVVFVIASTVSIWAAGLALDALASRRAARSPACPGPQQSARHQPQEARKARAPP